MSDLPQEQIMAISSAGQKKAAVGQHTVFIADIGVKKTQENL